MRHNNHLLAIYVLLLGLLVPLTAYANMVWPALYLSARMYDLSWVWAIIIGLLIESYFYGKILSCSIRKALKATIIVNAVSAVVGVVAIPFSGIVWEIMSMPLQKILDVGTFWIGAWFGTVIFAAFTNSLIEGMSLKLIFKITFTKRVFRQLLIANMLSLSIVLITLFIDMPDV